VRSASGEHFVRYEHRLAASSPSGGLAAAVWLAETAGVGGDSDRAVAGARREGRTPGVDGVSQGELTGRVGVQVVT